MHSHVFSGLEGAGGTDTLTSATQTCVLRPPSPHVRPRSVLALALDLVLSGNGELYAIIGLSLRVTLTAVAIACLIGLPLGAALAVLRFPGRSALVAVLNALMGLPPVVVGLVVYLMLSRSGPLGVLGLLYTPTAMIIAQAILVTPVPRSPASR